MIGKQKVRQSSCNIKPFPHLRSGAEGIMTQVDPVRFIGLSLEQNVLFAHNHSFDDYVL